MSPIGLRFHPSRLRPGRELTYARYGLWHYVQPEKQKQRPYADLQRAGISLRGLIRTMLFKRFESSVAAFCETLKRMIQTHSRFLQALAEGFVPAGEEAEELLGRGGTIDEAEFLEALAAVSGRYDLRDFDAEKLRKHIAADRDLLQTMLDLVEPITPDQDDKLQTLLARLEEEPIRGQKCLIFTQYADTAEYLYRNLNPDGQREIRSSAIVSRRSMTPSARMRRSWM